MNRSFGRNHAILTSISNLYCRLQLQKGSQLFPFRKRLSKGSIQNLWYEDCTRISRHVPDCQHLFATLFTALHRHGDGQSFPEPHTPKPDMEWRVVIVKADQFFVSYSSAKRDNTGTWLNIRMQTWPSVVHWGAWRQHAARPCSCDSDCILLQHARPEIVTISHAVHLRNLRPLQLADSLSVRLFEGQTDLHSSYANRWNGSELKIAAPTAFAPSFTILLRKLRHAIVLLLLKTYLVKEAFSLTVITNSINWCEHHSIHSCIFYWVYQLSAVTSVGFDTFPVV